MNKTELESKHLADLHTLAEEAGVERYRMLSRAELIEKLAGGEAKGGSKTSSARGGDPQRRRQRDRDRNRGGERRPREPRRQRDSAGAERKEGNRGRKDSQEKKADQPKPKPKIAPATTPAPGRPKRKRRRRRWGRRRKGVQVHDLLLPVSSGRQALVYGETREGCTGLLRGLAADLSEGKGPDPIALLIDPAPEELADWKRDAPKVEIVVASQDRHAEDAVAQAVRRAEGGDEVILLIDSLSRCEETFGDADLAKELFGAGIGLGGSGALSVIAALERSQ